MAESPQVAQAPFDDREADVILRSSDNVDFYVYKVVLSLASPFFKGMFALKQPSSEAQETPIIDVAEDRITLDCLLRYCYPIPDPTISELTLAERVIAAAQKYDLKEASDIPRIALLPFASSHPLQVYTIACRFGCEEVAQAAAKAKKAKPRYMTSLVEIYTTDMDDIPAGCLHRLIKFMETDVSQFCKPPTTTSASPVVWNADRVSSTWPFNRSDTDMVLRSSDNVEFPIHRLVMELHGQSAGVLSENGDSVFRSRCTDGVYAVPDRSAVLGVLLRLCYPSFSDDEPSLSGWTTERYCDPLTVEVIEAAERLAIDSVVRDYTALWDKHEHQDPLATYAAAVRLGWSTKASKSALKAIQRHSPADLYTPAIETLPASYLYNLIKFSHRFYEKIMHPVSVRIGTFTSSARGSRPWEHRADFTSFDTVPILAAVSEAAARRSLIQQTPQDFVSLVTELQTMVSKIASGLKPE